jgi:soluble lytic murein transglycosylase-like protein
MDILMQNHTSPEDRYGMLQSLGGLGSMDPISNSINNSHNNGSSSHWEDVAQRMATNQYGYSPQDFSKLDSIIGRESSWDPNAVNDSSGAYGIPQILPSAHPNTHLEDNPRGQIKWLLNYIQERYGGVDNALAFKDREGWY